MATGAKDIVQDDVFCFATLYNERSIASKPHNSVQWDRGHSKSASMGQ